MTVGRRIAGLACGAGAALGLVWLSHVPVSSARENTAALRLAWRARPERIEHCVTQSPETLAALPAHMRQATICEGINASYQLDVRVDGDVVVERVVSPGGVRRDRPLYVFQEVPLPAGPHHVRVTFTRVEVAPSGTDDAVNERDVLREAIPAELIWEKELAFPANRVQLISYDPGRQALVEVVPP